MNSEAVKVIELVKKYGKIYALKGISFIVREGEIYGVLGPNGAGKTTLLRAIAGAVKPTRGRILVYGYDSFNEDRIVKTLVGVVPELPSLYNELSIEENLYFIGLIRGLKRRDIKYRIEELDGILNISSYLKIKYGLLSKGFKRRVDIAAALIHEPRILLLDEPTSGLDVLSASRIREVIVELADRKHTIIIASHYIDEVMNISSRVLLLYKGSKVVEEEPEVLRNMLNLPKTIRIYLRDRSLSGKIIESIQPYIIEYSIRGSMLSVKTKHSIETLLEILDKFHEDVKDLEVIPPSWSEIFRGYIEPLEDRCGKCPLATGV